MPPRRIGSRLRILGIVPAVLAGVLVLGWLVSDARPLVVSSSPAAEQALFADIYGGPECGYAPAPAG